MEVGRPAVRASFPCAVTSPIQPRPGADVDRLCPTLIRGQVTAEVPQHVPNVDIGAILRRGAPLGRRLGRRFRGLLRRRSRGRRRPHWWHAWWLRQVQHSPHGKLLIHPAAPRVGELLPVALDPPPGSGERPELLGGVRNRVKNLPYKRGGWGEARPATGYTVITSREKHH